MLLTITLRDRDTSDVLRRIDADNASARWQGQATVPQHLLRPGPARVQRVPSVGRLSLATPLSDARMTHLGRCHSA